MLRHILVLLGIFAVLPRWVAAESRRPVLDTTMGYYEVLKLWGPPKEKVLKEVKHEAQWLYPDGEVSFLEGRVIAWVDQNAPQSQEMDLARLPRAGNNILVSGPPGTGEQDDLAVEEILGEITKDDSVPAPPAGPLPIPVPPNMAGIERRGRPFDPMREPLGVQ